MPNPKPPQLFVLLSTLLIFITGCSYVAPSNITFDVPTGWEEEEVLDSVFFFNPNNRETHLQFVPEREDSSITSDIENFGDTIEWDKKHCSPYKLLSTETFELNGLQASEMKIECGQFDMYFRLTTVRIFKDGMYANINLQSPIDEVEKYDRLLSDILDSVEWD